MQWLHDRVWWIVGIALGVCAAVAGLALIFRRRVQPTPLPATDGGAAADAQVAIDEHHVEMAAVEAKITEILDEAEAIGGDAGANHAAARAADLFAEWD